MPYEKKIHRLFDDFGEKREVIPRDRRAAFLHHSRPSFSILTLATKKHFIEISFEARWAGLQGGLQPKANLPPRI